MLLCCVSVCIGVLCVVICMLCVLCVCYVCIVQMCECECVGVHPESQEQIQSLLLNDVLQEERAWILGTDCPKL